MKYLMGIDCGTGSVRVAIFDLRGQNRAYDIAEYPTTYPQNGCRMTRTGTLRLKKQFQGQSGNPA